MPRPRTQRLPSAKRRELLLAAAEERFATLGYHATDVASIAAAAGVTKVIAYRAFGSKQAIYLTLLNLHRDELLATLVASQRTEHADATQRISAGLKAWFFYVEGHPFAWKLLFRDTTGLVDLEAHHRAMRGQARQVIARLLVDHFCVPATDATATAEFLRSALVGLALWWLENPLEHGANVVRIAERLVMGALQRTDLPDE